MTTSNSNQSIPPFPPFPSVARFVALGAAKDAVARASRAINCGEALSLVIGPPGVGKSLVCNVLAQQFAESHDVVMLGEIPITDAPSFYRAVLHHLGVDYQSVPEGDLYVSLVDRISGEAMTRSGLLVIVDEAQLLTADVLEAIRTTTNIMKDQQPCVSAVVCGGVKLEDTLASASMEPFTQRVATRCYLHPMNATETRQYISDSIRACGSDPEATMTDEAMGAVHHACNGVPRLINQMMTEAIDCAADAEQSLIDETIIDRAWAMLQQLPSPMVDEQKIVHQGAPIEFGSLSELSDLPSITSDDNKLADLESDRQTESDQTTRISNDAWAENDITETSETAETDETAVSEIAECLEEAECHEEDVIEIADTSNESMLAALAAGPVADADAIEASGESTSDEPNEQTNIEDECLEEDFDEEFDAEIEEESPTMRVFSSETDDSETISDTTQATSAELTSETSTEQEVVTQAYDTKVESQANDQDLVNAQDVADEPTFVTAQMTPETSQLFGEFDAEESLAVHETVQPVQVQFASAAFTEDSSTIENDSLTEEVEAVESQPAVCSQEPPAELRQSQSIDFEASLHDEVLLLNEMATQARFGGVDAQNTFTNIDQPAASSFEEPPIWLVEEDVASTAQPQTTDPMAAQNAMQRDMQSVTLQQDESMNLDDVQLVNDDSDLLIIEDELDVVPRPYVAGGPSTERAVSVDFQAMLSKMRTGT